MNDQRSSGLSCDYCGLPIPGRGLVRTSPKTEPIYCCAGCRFAAGILAAESGDGHAHHLLIRLGFATFCTMNVLAFSMALWGRDVYGRHASESTAFADALDGTFRWATLLFAVPVLILLGGPLFANAYQAARRALITADMLVLLGVLSAFTYSIISVLRGDGRIYFEVGCVVLAFLTLGKWFEASGKLKMSQSLDELAKLLPSNVHLVTDNGSRDELREKIRVGDLIRVLAGERFAVDGRIISGTAEIDEQLVTGESRTVFKGSGDAVFSGTLNLDGDLRVEVTAAAGQETVSRLLELVRKARRAPGQYQRLTDRIAVWFVPLISMIAIATAIYQGNAESIDSGILSGLAVVLIACPCAFALAIPMAMWTAMGRAARGHVLFRSGQALEQLARIESMYFDKTGTLTSGDSDVTRLLTADGAEMREVTAIASSLAAASNHSYSMAIGRYAPRVANSLSSGTVTTIAGKGLSAIVRVGNVDRRVFLGNRRLMDENGFAIPGLLAQSIKEIGVEYSFVLIGWEQRVRGAFVLREQLRPEATTALHACRELGLGTTVLTGDSQARSELLAKLLHTSVWAERLPEDKVSAIQVERQNGRMVGMVGDGINDAPALAAADVGIAMGCGADLSRDSAAVCLMSNDLLRVPWAIGLARHTVRIIHQNLFWAFVYNIAGIGLAITGHLNPVWAGAAMAVSSVLVVTNSLRLNRFPEPPHQGVSALPPANTVERSSITLYDPVDRQFSEDMAPAEELQPSP